MINDILELLTENIHWIVFISIAIDSIPIAGMIMPEELVLSLAGFLVAQEGLSLTPLILIGSLTLIAGQVLLFFVSQKYGGVLLDILRIKPRQRAILERYINQNNVVVNIVMRLPSTMRAIIAILSGLGKQPIGRFLIYESIISTLRVSGYLILGYLIGGNVMDLESLLGQIMTLVMASVGVSILLSVFTSRELFKGED